MRHTIPDFCFSAHVLASLDDDCTLTERLMGHDVDAASAETRITRRPTVEDIGAEDLCGLLDAISSPIADADDVWA